MYSKELKHIGTVEYVTLCNINIMDMVNDGLGHSRIIWWYGVMHEKINNLCPECEAIWHLKTVK